MTDTWEVKSADGEVVTTLHGLARTLQTTPAKAAAHLLADDALAAAAPEALLAECKALHEVPVEPVEPEPEPEPEPTEVDAGAEEKGSPARKKPGGGTPPPIATGNFVSWSNGKGKVDLLVTSGKVPGVEGDVEGTSKSPAARVTVWVDGKPTKKKIAASTHTLRRIAPLDRQKKSADDPQSALVTIVAEATSDAEALGRPEYARVTGQQVKTVYDRGVESWPGYGVTNLDRQGWALGRVEHFVKVAAGEVEEKDAGHDRDLLHDEHPLAAVVLTMDDLDPTIRGLIESD